MSKKKLWLIDATAFCYRAFYALGGLTTSFGQPTNAVYGFINMLSKVLKNNKPDYLGICFDVSRKTFRQEKFVDYKINRPAMPEDLSSQIPIIKEIISAYRIAVFEKEGFEADDIIATICRLAKENDLDVVVVSQDKDILQLVDSSITVFAPNKEDGVYYDRDSVLARYGVPPERISDIVALMGDNVDNIPGVPGIGEKTASSLIKNFCSLDKLLDHIEEIKQEKIKESLKENMQRIRLNKELFLLDNNVDIEFDLDKLKLGVPDYKELFRLFKNLEFNSLLKELPKDKIGEMETVEISDCQDSDIPGLINPAEELIFLWDDKEGFIFCVKDKLFRIKDAGKDLKRILADKEVKKVSYDLKRAKASLLKKGLLLDGLYFDVMIAAYLLNPSKSDYSIESITWDYLHDSILQAQNPAVSSLKRIVQLKKILEEELNTKKLDSLFRELEMPLVGVLAELEMNGICLDEKIIRQLSREIEARLVDLVNDIYSISGIQFNINSPKQLRDILFNRMNLPVIKKSKTGPSTDEEVLKALSTKHPLPLLLLEYRQLTKIKNTYIDTLPGLINKDTGKIHTSFNQTGTETGRLSSSNPNLQNIPVSSEVGRKIRKAIIASSKGRLLISCDYSQVELRILAHLSKDDSLINAFNNNEDIHKTTASLIYGLDQDNITEQMREVAKRVNFGIIYGLTAYGLAKDLKIGPEEAQGFIDAYFIRYPKVKDYIQEQISRAREDGFVTTILGRRRYLNDINSRNQAIRQLSERQAINTPIQGSASDLIKMAMIDLHGKIKDRRLDVYMILQIHDELLFDVASDDLNIACNLIKERMENVLRLDVPLKVDIKKGVNWLEMESVY